MMSDRNSGKTIRAGPGTASRRGTLVEQEFPGARVGSELYSPIRFRATEICAPNSSKRLCFKLALDRN